MDSTEKNSSGIRSYLLVLSNLIFIAMLSITVGSCGGTSDQSGTEGGDTQILPVGDDRDESGSDENIQVGEILSELKNLLTTGGQGADTTEVEEADADKNRFNESQREKLRDSFRAAINTLDPSPEWFATRASRDAVVVLPGQTYAIQFEKLGINNTPIGPVLLDEVRTVVVIQRGQDDFEVVPDDSQNRYVRWVGDDGWIQVTVPEDLIQGRVLVAIRPNFGTDQQNMVAERISDVVSLDVWGLQGNVRDLSDDEVIYPLSNSFVELPLTSRFRLEEISVQVSQRIDTEVLVLPMVLEGVSVSIGEHVNFLSDGFPWGGRVSRVTNRGPQQLILVEPSWVDTYDIPNADRNFLVEHGLLSEFIVYNNDLWDVKTVKANKAVKSVTASNVPFGTVGCSDPSAFKLAFTPYFSLSPEVDIGVGVTVDMQGRDISCKFAGNRGLSNLNFNPVFKLGQEGLEWIVRSLVGLDFRAYLYGSIDSRLKSVNADGNTSPFGAYVSAYGRYNDGPKGNIDYGIRYPSDVSEGLDGVASKSNVDFGISGGLGVTVAFKDTAGALGSLLTFLGSSKLKGGLTATTGVFGGVSVKGVTPAYIRLKKEQGEQSAIGTKFAVEAKLIFSGAFLKVTRKLGLKLPNKLGVSEPIMPLKFWDGSFSAGEIVKRGASAENNTGLVGINSLIPTNSFVEWALEGFSTSGFVFPDDPLSSVYNDNSFQIDYSIAECEQAPIVAPVVGCLGPFCGLTRALEICNHGDEGASDENDVENGSEASTKEGIVYRYGNNLFGELSSGSGSQRLTSIEADRSLGLFEVSPTGNHVLYYTNPSADNSTYNAVGEIEIHLLSLETGEDTLLRTYSSNRQQGLYDVFWSHNDRYLLIESLSSSSYTAPVTSIQDQFLLFDTTIGENLESVHLSQIRKVSWSPQKQLLAIVYENTPSTIEIWSPSSGRLLVIEDALNASGGHSNLHWDSSGRFLAAANTSYQSIGIVNINRGTTVSYALDGNDNHTPDIAWSAGGLVSAMSSSGIVVISPDSGVVFRHNSDDYYNSAEWAPVSNKIIFATGPGFNKARNLSIYDHETANSDTLFRTEIYNLSRSFWSPDEKQLFLSLRTIDASDIGVMSIDVIGKEAKVLQHPLMTGSFRMHFVDNNNAYFVAGAYLFAYNRNETNLAFVSKYPYVLDSSLNSVYFHFSIGDSRDVSSIFTDVYRAPLSNIEFDVGHDWMPPESHDLMPHYVKVSDHNAAYDDTNGLWITPLGAR